MWIVGKYQDQIKANIEEPLMKANEIEKPVVLIVDDDAGMRQTIDDLLSYTGHEVRTARSVREALAMIGQQNAMPDVIISDVNMPGIDGYQFFDTLRATPAGAQIPFIFLTGQHDRAAERDYRSARHVMKPFEVPDLLAAVKDALQPVQPDVKIRVTFEIEGHEVVADMLANLLHNDTLASAMQRMAQAIEKQSVIEHCPVHHQPPEAVISLSSTGGLTTHVRGCCPSVVKSTTRLLGNTVKDTAPLRTQLNLVLQPHGAKQPLVVSVDQIDDWIIGRGDPERDPTPDIDLSPYGALEAGVSRNHATLIWWHGALHIVDKGSANGTYLNGQRLMPDHPAPLSDGDRLTLANLTLSLNFENTAADTP